MSNTCPAKNVALLVVTIGASVGPRSAWTHLSQARHVHAKLHKARLLMGLRVKLCKVRVMHSSESMRCRRVGICNGCSEAAVCPAAQLDSCMTAEFQGPGFTV